jgi:hypothetical protein
MDAVIFDDGTTGVDVLLGNGQLRGCGAGCRRYAHPLTQCGTRKYEARSGGVRGRYAVPQSWRTGVGVSSRWRDRAAAGEVGSPELGIRALRRPIGTLLASQALEQLRENVACTGHRGLRRRDRALGDRAVS